ncbi:MAG: DUF885 domain-containing protein [Pirellula sp.]|nr:DUF885 domain-containing protein [Pirellula sp.]
MNNIGRNPLRLQTVGAWMAFLVGMAILFGEPVARAQSAADLEGLFQSFLEEECRIHPAFASAMGNHNHDHELDDLTPEARANDVERYRDWLKRISASIDLNALPRSSQIDAEIWMHALRYRIWQATETDDFANDPRVYLTYASDSVFGLLTQSTLPKHRNVENAARRISLIPTVVAAAKQSIKNPPKILTEIAIQRTQGAIDFYEEGIFVLADESRQLSLLKDPCEQAVSSLKEFKQYLENDVLPRSSGSWRLGKKKFYDKLELELDSGLTGDEVIAEARSEADRVEQEMYYVAKQLWHELFPDRVVPPDDPQGRRDTIRTVLNQLGKSHGKPEELVEDAKKTVAKIQTMIREKNILTLPNPDQCDIIEMPEFQRGFSAAYLNPAPPLDANAKSLYAISPPPSDWPESRQKAFLEEYNTYMLQILTIHEAYPGHYVQLDYSNRSPSLIRKVFASGVFAEGWAVYTEQMMLDQGYGHGDLALRLHQLKFYLRAVLNAILDHSMHCEDMSDQEAMTLLMERGYQTEGEAYGKVQRAKQSSCQLSTYFVGRTAFYRLRQSVQRARGDTFELGPFHEQVLNCGTLPVKYLPELVR